MALQTDDTVMQKLEIVGLSPEQIRQNLIIQSVVFRGFQSISASTEDLAKLPMRDQQVTLCNQTFGRGTNVGLSPVQALRRYAFNEPSESLRLAWDGAPRISPSLA